MNTVGVLLFVFGLVVCCISAYPSAISSERNVRVIRAAAALPDPHHLHHSYPRQNYGHSQSQAQAHAQSGSIYTPFASGAYSMASAGAGSGTGHGFFR